MTKMYLIVFLFFVGSLCGCSVNTKCKSRLELLQSGDESAIESMFLSYYKSLDRFESAVILLQTEFPEYSSRLRTSHYSDGYTKPVPIRDQEGNPTVYHYELSMPLLLDSKNTRNSSVHLIALYNEGKELVRLRIQTTPY
jgi:hypothetical protein